MRPCLCDQVSGPDFTSDQCRLCWLYYFDARYRQLFTEDDSGARPLTEPAAAHPCRHAGAILTRSPLRAADGDVYACALHERCTRGPNSGGVPSCTGCAEFAARPPYAFTRPVTRHLAYHVYPRRNNPAWRWNVEQLLRRIDLFNGRRVVAIVTDSTTDDPEAVKEAFAGQATAFLIQENDTRSREVVTFHALLERLLRDEPDDVIFYAHAKGVSRPWGPPCSVHAWAETLYELNLDYWPVVEHLLEYYPLCGAFQKLGHCFAGSASAWHYAGTFFWARSREVLRRNWRTVVENNGDPAYEPSWAMEAWPGLHFKPWEGGCVFHRRPGAVPVGGLDPGMNLFSAAYLRDVVAPELAAWRTGHRQFRQRLAPTPRQDEIGMKAGPARAAPVKFNLIYHCAPFPGWRFNVRQLLKHKDYWNGKRVLGLVQGPGLDSVARVKAELPAGWFHDFIVRDNVPELREATTYRDLVQAVADPDPAQATFFAHTKGVTAPRPRACSAHWRDTMYHGCLDNFAMVKAALARFNSAGCYRMRTHPCHFPAWQLPPWGPWIFAGSFYWFRHDRVFGNPHWQDVPWQAANIAEWFVSLSMPIQESYCLLYDEYTPGAIGDPMSYGPYCDELVP